MRHRVVGDFIEPTREPSTPQQELEQDGKPAPGCTGLVAQLLQLVADQGEMVNDVIEAHLARHRQRPNGSCGMRVIMPAPFRCRAPHAIEQTLAAELGIPTGPCVIQERVRTIRVTENRERVM